MATWLIEGVKMVNEETIAMRDLFMSGLSLKKYAGTGREHRKPTQVRDDLISHSRSLTHSLREYMKIRNKRILSFIECIEDFDNRAGAERKRLIDIESKGNESLKDLDNLIIELGDNAMKRGKQKIGIGPFMDRVSSIFKEYTDDIGNMNESIFDRAEGLVQAGLKADNEFVAELASLLTEPRKRDLFKNKEDL